MLYVNVTACLLHKATMMKLQNYKVTKLQNAVSLIIDIEYPFGVIQQHTYITRRGAHRAIK